jgi:hypothetical protein
MMFGGVAAEHLVLYRVLSSMPHPDKKQRPT